MTDNKNLILAIALSLVVLLGWSWAANRFFPTPKPQISASQPASPQTQSPSLGQSVGQSLGLSPAPSPVQPEVLAGGQQVPRVLQPRAAVLGSTPRVRIQTPSLTGSINLKGALIDDLMLVRQRESISRKSAPVRLLSPLGARGSYIASFGWASQNVQVPTLDTAWTADSAELTSDHPVTLSTVMPDGTRYQMRIAVDDGYLFSVDQRVVNGSANPVTIRSTGLVSRADKSSDPDSWTNHVGPIGVFDAKADYGIAFKDLDKDGSRAVDGTGWLGFTDKYWLTALAPAGPMSGDFRRSPASGGYQADYALAPTSVGPGQSLDTKSRLFAGAKEKSWLDRYEANGFPMLTRAIDWGWFRWFMIPIFDLLLILFHTLGNFGFAIIALTLIVRTIMFPIAHKQFQSMAAMRKVQPKLKALQARFKDDKTKLQQETLKLYQAEKINPAAGCLPLVLQIPIFYALYKVLTVSVEMRHQPFIAWIKDLSAPDPLTPINLFGLLPFTPPHFLAIGVLPILVGATQWATMKLNPQPMDPAQAQVFSIMPWVLIFVMAPFAAGLQLYWMTNNLLTIAQQSWLYRKYGLHLSDTHPVKT
ncbi:MAG: membrane protein insertase YidC [Sphingomicrobium sp.]